MIWYIGTFLVVFLTLVAAYASAYAAKQQMLERKATRRNYQFQFIPFLLFLTLCGVGLVFLLPALVAIEYGIQSFFIFNTVVLLASLLNGFLRIKRAGALLIDTGKIPQGKTFLWAAGFQLGSALVYTWGFFSDGIPSPDRLAKGLPMLVLLLTLAAASLVGGLGRTQFREKGICSLGGLLEWQKIKSFYWESSNPNTLTLELKPRSSLIFQRFGSIPIPERHREAVNQILNQYVQAVDT
ncbi:MULTISPECIES: hypothetical protein [Trichocoleus]|uniref:DUF5673 domain-containing protein n=1 Tax=Trichocoleus desertorum GB2-A4 TaxID=2933944 RepID=A0ABV0JF14_9CYAN|nr:hypothetical protein [Trichocoleus sp. FACHB-46]MBD1865035.1 hypothetical protein [Trichocoleus sp. FACHB-46]